MKTRFNICKLIICLYKGTYTHVLCLKIQSRGLFINFISIWERENDDSNHKVNVMLLWIKVKLCNTPFNIIHREIIIHPNLNIDIHTYDRLIFFKVNNELVSIHDNS